MLKSVGDKSEPRVAPALMSKTLEDATLIDT